MLKEAGLGYDIVTAGHGGPLVTPKEPVAFQEGNQTQEMNALTVQSFGWENISDIAPVVHHIQTSKALQKVHMILSPPRDHNGDPSGLGFVVAKRIAEAVVANSSVQEFLVTLNLRGNSFEELADFFRATPSITGMILDGEDIIEYNDRGTNAAMENLVDAVVALPRLKALSVSTWHSFHGLVMNRLLDPSKCRNRLETLSVQYIAPNSHYILATIAYLDSPAAALLKSVQIDCDPVQEMAPLCQAHQGLQNLTSLSLSFFGIHEDGVAILKACLENATKLQKLDLKTGKTNQNDTFLPALQSKQSLLELTLHDTNQGSHSWSSLSAFLSKNKWIQSLNIIVETNDGMLLHHLNVQYGDWDTFQNACRLDFSALSQSLADPTGNESLCAVEHLGVGLYEIDSGVPLGSMATLFGSPHCQLKSIAIDLDSHRPSVFPGLLSVLAKIQDRPALENLELGFCRPWATQGDGGAATFTENLITALPQLQHLTSLKLSSTENWKFSLGDDARKTAFLKAMQENNTSLETLQFPVDDPVLQAALHQLCFRNKAMKAASSVPIAVLPLLLQRVKNEGCVAQVLHTFLRALPDTVDRMGRSTADSERSHKRKWQPATMDG